MAFAICKRNNGNIVKYDVMAIMWLIICNGMKESVMAIMANNNSVMYVMWKIAYEN